MLNRIRGILLNNYVGSIVVGYLAAQGILSLLTLVVQPGLVYLSSYERSLSTSVAFDTAFQLRAYLTPVVHGLLELGIAYLVGCWLWPAPAPEVTEAADATDATDA